MKRSTIITMICLAPFAAFANPYILDPGSLIAFWVVAFWAFVVETAIVTLVLAFCGLQPVRIFIIYFLIKAAVFLFLFQPLLEKGWSIPILELLVVFIDGLVIKILAGLGALQTESYGKLGWLTAFMISLIGNVVSFFIGLIASRKPWEIG
jgi:hypothetical protein